MAADTPLLGQIQSFGFNFAPKGWHMCDGTLMPINTNQALFALLGTQYGGNGTTTFALPDLRGRSARGQGQGPGLSVCTMGEIIGTETITLLSANLPPHNHTIVTAPGSQGPKASSLPGVSTAPSTINSTLAVLQDPNLGATNNFYNAETPDIALHSSAPSPSLAPAGSSAPVDNMQPYLTINYSIALQGIFPSRN